MFKRGDKNNTPPSASDEEKTLLVGPPTSQRRLRWPARDAAADQPATMPAAAESRRAHVLPVQPAGHETPQPDENMTRVITSAHRADGGQPTEQDAVVGWLVVTEGPGKGRSVEIAAGMSAIGRGPDQRIRMDFGDDMISRENHAALTFDVRSNRFFLTHGGGKNLTYLNGEPVLAPVELKGHETISIGNTELKFVRFCGQDFSWT